MAPLTPRSILVYVGSHPDDAIGENLLKIPFIRSIRKTFPEATLTWIPGYGPAQFQGVLKPLAEGLIDDHITDLYLENRFSRLLRGNPLPGRHFDLIIDTQTNMLRTLQLKMIPHRWFISRAWKWAISSRRPPAGPPLGRNIVERLNALVMAASGTVEEPPHGVELAPKWREAAAWLLPAGPTYIGLAPGAGNKDKGKCWPLDNYLAVARDQLAKGRVPVFLPGPAEADWVGRMRAEAPGALVPVFDHAERLDGLRGPTLDIALAGRLTAAVANCSGTGHMLALGGASMVSLFGPTNPVKYRPYALRVICLKTDDFGGGDMAVIPVSAVIDAVDTHVQAGAA